MASLATPSAVSWPNVTSVQSMSLSMVLGTPTTGTFSSDSQCAAVSVPSPPIGISTSMPLSSSVCLIWSRPGLQLVGVHPRGAEHGAALGEQPVVAVVVAQLDTTVLEQPTPAVEEADDLTSRTARRRCGRPRGSPRSGRDSRRRRSGFRCACGLSSPSLQTRRWQRTSRSLIGGTDAVEPVVGQRGRHDLQSDGQVVVG